MSVVNRTRNAPDPTGQSPSAASPPVPDQPAAVLPMPNAPTVPTAMPRTAPHSRVPRTRASSAWIGVCTALVTFVVLLVFMLQNTGRVEINFLWLEGTLPLAMALLIAAVGAGVLAMTVGAVRIAQLRRLFGRRH